LKRGSSTGIAVRCGAYELLGDKSLQEELDFSAYAVVVESELQDCSLKLDFYDNEKLHGEFESLRTRLIFGSCV
ncbi:unnamed protein product, partial [Durusdinium trenchii]